MQKGNSTESVTLQRRKKETLGLSGLSCRAAAAQEFAVSLEIGCCCALTDVLCMYHHFNSQTLKLMMSRPCFQRDSYTRICVLCFSASASSACCQTPLIPDAKADL